MSETLFKRKHAADVVSRLVGIVFLLAMLTAGLSVPAQNIIRPNIEGPAGLQVNSYTGSLFTQRTDMVIPGRGLSLDVSFSYNSSARDSDFGFGYGWTLSWNQFYVRDSSGQGITFYRSDGRKDHYLKSGSAWTAPKGIFDVLTEYEPDKFLLTTKSATQVFFENAGHKKLTRVKERNGNDITLGYAGNALVSLTDASGRTLSLAWANNHLASIRADAAMPARVIQYSYNAAGCLVSVKDPLGNLTSYAYGAARMMSAVTSPNRFSTSITYYGQAAVSKLISCQRELNLTYNAAQLKTYVIEKGQGKTLSTTYAFDGDGRLSERTGNCCGFKNSYGYDQDNNIAFITNANGYTTRYSYDKRGNPVSETDPLNRTILYTNESVFNQITSITDKASNKTALKYDGKGNLVETINALNITTSYTYDDKGDRISATNGKGVKTEWTYDAYGSVATMKDALGSIDTYSVDAWGNLVSHTDAAGNKTHFTYDASDQLVSQRDALDGVMQYTYDASGNRLTVTDARGNVTAIRYNENDLPIAITDATEKVTALEYDPFNNVVAGIDANGFATRNTYDNLNRLVSTANAAGETTSFTYDGNGNRIAMMMPNGNIIRFTYDPLNRVVETADNSGLISAVTYDANGNKQSEHDGNGQTTTYRYDAINRLVSSADAAGNTAFYTYDANGNLLSETDRNNQTTSYAYDLLDRQVSSTDAKKNVTQMAWDRLDNNVSVTDANGNMTAYAYDALSRKTRETFADNSTKAYTYDAAGNLVSRKDNKGEITKYSYDKLNRLTTRLYPNAEESFSYDAVGRMTSAKNANATVGFTYDPAGRLASETLNGKTTSYAYNDATSTKSITYPGGRVIRRELDGRNRLKAIREGTSSLAEFTYDATGQLLSRKYANNTTTAFKYDGNGRITELTANPSRFVDMAYSYDREGNPQAAQFKHKPERSETYQYDPLGQVTGFQKGTAAPSTFNYDGVGNRTMAQVNGATVSYAVNAMNAYTTVGAATLSYDGNGNVTNDSRNTYSYDPENRMVAVNNGTKAAYLYDALGRRIKKIVGTDTLNYFYDGQQVIEERSNADSLKASYVWGTWIDDIVSTTRNNQSYFYHANTIGSITSITNASGNVVERYDYDAWGKMSVSDGNYTPLSISAIGNVYAYTGQRMEWETGFYFYRSRNYDPEHGRFLQRDPLEYVDGLALYVYVSNMPSTMIDPYGTWSINWCSKWVNYFQTGLDILGFIPIYGEIFDLINSGIYLKKGDYENAALSLIAVIPGPTEFATGARVIRKTISITEEVIVDLNKINKSERWIAAEKKLAEAAKGKSGSSATDFVVTEKGTVIPIPDGATGPINPKKGSGMTYEKGSGGKGMDKDVTGVRVMDPNRYQGRRANYMNRTGQTVDPKTGKTISNNDPRGHLTIH